MQRQICKKTNNTFCQEETAQSEHVTYIHTRVVVLVPNEEAIFDDNPVAQSNPGQNAILHISITWWANLVLFKCTSDITNRKCIGNIRNHNLKISVSAFGFGFLHKVLLRRKHCDKIINFHAATLNERKIKPKESNSLVFMALKNCEVKS